MKYLSESQAWEKIARAFYKPPSKRDKLEKELTQQGICLSLLELRQASHITVDQDSHMLGKTMDDVELYCTSLFFCARNRPNQILRANYCILQKAIVDSGGI